MPIAGYRFLLCLALLFGVAGCGGGSGGERPIVIDGAGVGRIEAAMQGVMDRHSPPGIAVAVVRGGKLVYADAWGSADLAGSEPMRPDHLFRVASISKPITGLAALRAAEEGLLDFDAAAFDILSGFLPQSGADPRIGQVTVWHLLHHTSGWNLWDYPSDPLFRSGEIATTMGSTLPPDPQTLTRWIARQPLAADPGTRFSYTNIGFIVLGRVIEQTTGFVYEDFVQRFVLQPAGITQAALGGITRNERLPNEVEYESFRDTIWSSVFDGSTIVQEPAYGGLNLLGFDASSAWVISAIDLVRLAAAADGNAVYPDIISPQSFELMSTSGTPAGNTPIGAAWFLGLRADGSTAEWNHSGGMPGTTSFLARLPTGIIIAVISNTARDPAFFDDLVGGLVAAVNGITDWPDTDLF
jgi:CubicO group peptidase (beta-lactamase class C family)